MSAIYCPLCQKKLGEYLSGVYVTRCPRCKSLVRLVNEIRTDTEVDKVLKPM